MPGVRVVCIFHQLNESHRLIADQMLAQYRDEPRSGAKDEPAVY
jgi:hypothetical protein